ncbi:PREDICTED: uncharacterized protein LOC105457690 isoform X2 [Wasmannia auropunctata]|nr:PREDICTED: uncharacterized protein LOC105457690 isoform X2 [Wasmannia auropunctata]
MFTDRLVIQKAGEQRSSGYLKSGARPNKRSNEPQCYHSAYSIVRDYINKLEEPTTRRDDDDDFSLVTVTSVSLQESTGSTFTGSVCTNWEEKFACRALQGRGRVFSYRKRRAHFGDGIFSAPAGVCPRHVTSSVIRRNTGDSRLVFVWPQKASRGRLSNVLLPLLRSVLVGLLFVDALHLWPGEFLPTSLPPTMPITLPPVKCNVIEPR